MILARLASNADGEIWPLSIWIKYVDIENDSSDMSCYLEKVMEIDDKGMPVQLTNFTETQLVIY